MQKFIKVKDWLGKTTSKRMVNQEEIVAYLKCNPGQTEREIYLDLYSYDISSSNLPSKKYADCLRRAIAKQRVSRAKAIVGAKKVFIYFAI